MARRKREVEPRVALTEPLSVSGADGRPLLELPDVAVAEFRRALTQMLAVDALPARISLVAAIRREGVTQVALSIGAILAHDLERRVCVVDLNWHWPAAALAGSSEQPASPGLAGVLRGEAQLEQAVLHSSLPGLAYLPAGELPAARRTVLARGAILREQIEALSRLFDHLLLDIPAILASSDAIPLAALGQACVVVVRQGITPRGQVLQALDCIKQLPVLGVMLNQVRIQTPGWIRRLIPQG